MRYFLLLETPAGRDAYDLDTDDYAEAVAKVPAAKSVAGFPAAYSEDHVATLTYDPHPKLIARFTVHTVDLSTVNTTAYERAELNAGQAARIDHARATLEGLDADTLDKLLADPAVTALLARPRAGNPTGARP